MPDPIWLIMGVVALLLLLGAVAWWATRPSKEPPEPPRSDAYIDALGFEDDEGR